MKTELSGRCHHQANNMFQVSGDPTGHEEVERGCLEVRVARRHVALGEQIHHREKEIRRARTKIVHGSCDRQAAACCLERGVVVLDN
jgi:hypothetical protein